MIVYADTSVVLRILFANQVFQRASETFPTVVGTLDAIHLATALSIREIENVEVLLTHDSQLATAAKSLGFEVMGIDQ